jgi:TetR/AcrR family transcriptional regulator, transcriptional repressor for nem operon
MNEDVTMAKARQRGETDTAARILDIAERLVQSRGFNAFSYADIAAELNVTKASLHYHYPGKAELGEALIGRYAARFSEALTAIDADGGDAPSRLAAYAAIYGDVLRDRRMCLCGMLAADYETLPEPMQAAVIRFFDENVAWLAGVVEEGTREGTLRPSGSAQDAAQALLGGLEGALLVARPYGDVTRFEGAAAGLLTGLAAPA